MILPNARAKSNFTKTYMVMKSIFLDNNSTTMVDDEVIEAMLECQKTYMALIMMFHGILSDTLLGLKPALV